MHWTAFWGFFPLVCLVMMAVMLLVMMRAGGMCCMSRMRGRRKPDSRDAARQSPRS
jgi:hypothetical protein